MATLVLDHGDGHGDHLGPAISLRSWLRDGWAILFSHPLDFVCCELEMDRWLVLLQKAFAAQRVRPLALGGANAREDSWVTRITSDHRTVCLQPDRDSSDLQARALREHVTSHDRRFVSIIDTDMRRHKTFSYADCTSLPSPLDFLAWIRSFQARRQAPGPDRRNEGAIRIEQLIAARWRSYRGGAGCDYGARVRAG